MPVNLSLNPGRTRAAIVFEHHPGNLLTAEIVGQLHAALTDLEDLPHLRLVTIEGAGTDFSFGASVAEHAPEQIASVLPATHALLSALLEVPAPTAAVVRGRCLGGGFELALACDFILAADTATFGLPEIALGVFPPPTEDMYTPQGWAYMSALMNTGYMMPVIGLICAVNLILVLMGQTALAALLLAPFTVNVMLFHWFLDASPIGPASIPAYVLLVCNAFYLWKHWALYRKIWL